MKKLLKVKWPPKSGSDWGWIEEDDFNLDLHEHYEGKQTPPEPEFEGQEDIALEQSAPEMEPQAEDTLILESQSESAEDLDQVMTLIKARSAELDKLYKEQGYQAIRSIAKEAGIVDRPDGGWDEAIPAILKHEFSSHSHLIG